MKTTRILIAIAIASDLYQPHIPAFTFSPVLGFCGLTPRAACGIVPA